MIVVDLTAVTTTESKTKKVECVDLTESESVDIDIFPIVNMKLRSKRVVNHPSNLCHCNSFEEDLQIVTDELKGLLKMKNTSTKSKTKSVQNKYNNNTKSRFFFYQHYFDNYYSYTFSGVGFGGSPSENFVHGAASAATKECDHDRKGIYFLI